MRTVPLIPDLKSRLAALQRRPADNGLEYHAITFAVENDGRWMLGCLCTRWIGWADVKRRVEWRVSDPIDARYAEGLTAVGIDCVFVVNVPDLLLFMQTGGAALVERDLAERFFPRLLKPGSSYLHGRSGFIDRSLLPRGTRSRRPSTRCREAVLTRDARRCRVCDRDPRHFIDMELEVHHIRPWAEGGTSHPTNLITLCRRCHKQLKPHFDRGLFELVTQDDGITSIRQLAKRSAELRSLVE